MFLNQSTCLYITTQSQRLINDKEKDLQPQKKVIFVPSVVEVYIMQLSIPTKWIVSNSRIL